MALKLGDIPLIANSLKYGTTQSVKLLNIVLGNPDFDRSSRKKMRNFTSFPENFDLQKHKELLLKDFTLPDFISVANLLHLNTTGEKKALCENIVNALANLTEFHTSLDVSFLSDSEIETSSIFSPSLPCSGTEAIKVGQCPLPLNSPQTENFIPPATHVFLPSAESDQSLSVNFPNAQTGKTVNSDTAVSELSSQFWILLRDLSSTCRNFSANDSYSIHGFFNDIEDNFNLFPTLTDQQRLIFAKRLITGPAKTFLFSQRNLHTYDAFKSALIAEFSEKVSSIDIHKQLDLVLVWFGALRSLYAQHAANWTGTNGLT